MLSAARGLRLVRRQGGAPPPPRRFGAAPVAPVSRRCLVEVGGSRPVRPAVRPPVGTPRESPPCWWHRLAGVRAGLLHATASIRGAGKRTAILVQAPARSSEHLAGGCLPLDEGAVAAKTERGALMGELFAAHSFCRAFRTSGESLANLAGRSRPRSRLRLPLLSLLDAWEGGLALGQVRRQHGQDDYSAPRRGVLCDRRQGRAHAGPSRWRFGWVALRPGADSSGRAVGARGATCAPSGCACLVMLSLPFAR